MLPNAFVYEQIARQDKMGDFLKDYGAHLLGFVALAQVWVIALWKNIYVKAPLRFILQGLSRSGLEILDHPFHFSARYAYVVAMCLLTRCGCKLPE